MKLFPAFFDRLAEPAPMVLMYHRVAEPETDVWELGVSPAHFEAQLQILRKTKKVIPLASMVEGIRKKSLKRNSVSITFDDGYVDNYLVAKPLLEKYRLPATFFITTSHIGSTREFWWDELEHLILNTPHLPASLSLSLGKEKQQINYCLEGESYLSEVLGNKHKHWKAATEAPPTLRCALYLQLYLLLQPLEQAELQQDLQKIRIWAGAGLVERPAYRSVSEQQLLELSQHKLFAIGAHTVTHPALAFHGAQQQRQEVRESKLYLEALTRKEIDLLAYPYGSHNAETVAAAKELGFAGAVTTREELVTRQTAPYTIGRLQVKNWSGLEFQGQLHRWENMLSPQQA